MKKFILFLCTVAAGGEGPALGARPFDCASIDGERWYACLGAGGGAAGDRGGECCEAGGSG